MNGKKGFKHSRIHLRVVNSIPLIAIDGINHNLMHFKRKVDWNDEMNLRVVDSAFRSEDETTEFESTEAEAFVTSREYFFLPFLAPEYWTYLFPRQAESLEVMFTI